ncbi:2-hydroxyacyl-CoA dehydratase family protein [Nesterenkonia haasae]|uniref:2-hydroxyacyl-CoA dehydratase family protein n=1 Tax=Nesterenkonia haasae TaxID=2587813 RepID=UPI001391CB89|nr:2-hydroxyacyl-CoA dehydratase family protein [Nesterenkonia haasae]NDK31134.1 2-hydroxyacyl-CoA dehydratase [Nesterenkonia haasae]
MNLSAAGEYAARSGHRIGIVGADVPRQIVMASRALPVRVFGTWDGPITAEATRLLGAVDAVTTRILDSLLVPSQYRFDGLVICNDSMAHLRLFYIARLLSQQGRLPFPVHLVDAPRGTGGPRRQFVTRQFAQLAQFAETITGHALDGESVLSAAQEEHEIGAALRRLRQRRLAQHCSGAEALKAYRAATQETPDVAVRIIDAAVSSGIEGARRIYMTGSSHPDETIYGLLEDAGHVVITEDHDTGDSSWVGEAIDEADPDVLFERLANQHAVRPPLAARALTSERVQHLTRGVEETRCVGAVSLIRELDDAPAWDLPEQETALRARNLPMASRVRIAAAGAVEAAQSIIGELKGPKWRESR